MFVAVGRVRGVPPVLFDRFPAMSLPFAILRIFRRESRRAETRAASRVANFRITLDCC
jgi:hypothetical protein